MSCVYLHWARKYNRGNTSWLWGIARCTWIKRKLGDTGRRKANICFGCWSVNTIDAGHTGWLRRGQGAEVHGGEWCQDVGGVFTSCYTCIIIIFFFSVKLWKILEGLGRQLENKSCGPCNCTPASLPAGVCRREAAQMKIISSCSHAHLQWLILKGHQMARQHIFVQGVQLSVLTLDRYAWYACGTWGTKRRWGRIRFSFGSITVNLETLTCRRALFGLDSLNLAKNSFVIFLYQSFKILPPFPTLLNFSIFFLPFPSSFLKLFLGPYYILQLCNGWKCIQGFPGGSDGKESACISGDLSSVPGLGRSPGGGHGNLL